MIARHIFADFLIIFALFFFIHDSADDYFRADIADIAVYDISMHIS